MCPSVIFMFEPCLLQHLPQWVPSALCWAGWGQLRKWREMCGQQAVLSWKSSALSGRNVSEFHAECQTPRPPAQGTRKWKCPRGQPTGNSPHPAAGYRPGSTGCRRHGVGEARGPRRPGQEEAGQRRPKSSRGDSTEHSPAFGGERPWGSAHTSRFWGTGAACLQGAKCSVDSAGLG